MRDFRVAVWLLLATGLALGVAGDLLLRSSDAPALGCFLFITLCVTDAVVLQRRAARPLSGEAVFLLGAGVAFAAMLAWRDAPLLKLTALAAAASALMLSAFRAGAAWARRAGVGEYVVAMISAGLHAVFGTVAVLASIDRGDLREQSHRGVAARRVLAIGRGVVLAVPLLVVFGGLLITADAVFAHMVTTAFRVNLETVASHVLLIGFLAWLTTGALGGFLRGTGTPIPADLKPEGGRIGIGEVGVVLGLLATLFAVFVAVQFRYLFGGAGLVEVTPGLTYAEYARRGFFELLAVVILSLPLLLVTDWLLRRDTKRDERILRGLAVVHVLLLIAIAVSALQRMRLYTAAYGLTEDRFFATAFLLLVSAVLVWFAVVVLADRRQQFAFGTLIAAYVTAAILFVVNPDAVIARVNIDRALSGTAVLPLDRVHATSLSADAVPVLLDRLPALDPAAQCAIAKRLLERWPPAQPTSFSNWNISVVRAKQLIGEHASDLNTYQARCG